MDEGSHSKSYDKIPECHWQQQELYKHSSVAWIFEQSNMSFTLCCS